MSWLSKLKRFITGAPLPYVFATAPTVDESKVTEDKRQQDLYQIFLKNVRWKMRQQCINRSSNMPLPVWWLNHMDQETKDKAISTLKSCGYELIRMDSQNYLLRW